MQSGVWDIVPVLLKQVELVLLLKTCAIVVLTHQLELGPLLGELLCETVLRQNGAGLSGLLVLRAGRQQVGNLTLLECLMGVVELREKEFAVAAVFGAYGLRLPVCAHVGCSDASCD